MFMTIFLDHFDQRFGCLQHLFACKKINNNNNNNIYIYIWELLIEMKSAGKYYFSK